MSDEALTNREKRNLELVKEWAKAWETDRERMVDEVYADTTEVFTPFQNTCRSRRGQSKEHWRGVEAAVSARSQSRKMNFVTTLAKGDVAAVEVAVTSTREDGTTGQGWYSAFLCFDDDGRIITDRTYMPGPRPTKREDMPPDSPMALILDDNS